MPTYGERGGWRLVARGKALPERSQNSGSWRQGAKEQSELMGEGGRGDSPPPHTHTHPQLGASIPDTLAHASLVRLALPAPLDSPPLPSKGPQPRHKLGAGAGLVLPLWASGSSFRGAPAPLDSSSFGSCLWGRIEAATQGSTRHQRWPFLRWPGRLPNEVTLPGLGLLFQCGWGGGGRLCQVSVKKSPVGLGQNVSLA